MLDACKRWARTSDSLTLLSKLRFRRIRYLLRILWSFSVVFLNSIEPSCFDRCILGKSPDTRDCIRITWNILKVNRLHHFKLNCDDHGEEKVTIPILKTLRCFTLFTALFKMYAIKQKLHTVGFDYSVYTLNWKMTEKQITSNDKISSLFKYNSICYQYHKLYKTPDLHCTEHDSAIFPAV